MHTFLPKKNPLKSYKTISKSLTLIENTAASLPKLLLTNKVQSSIDSLNEKSFSVDKILKAESKQEINQIMDDLRSAEVDFITIGQYLQPSVKHFPLDRYYKPQEFEELGAIAKAKGFLLVSSSPLTRSSYHADEDFAKLQQNRIKNN